MYYKYVLYVGNKIYPTALKIEVHDRFHSLWCITIQYLTSESLQYVYVFKSESFRVYVRVLHEVTNET